MAKSLSFYLVKNYRENYSLDCCTGILSNHESVLRSDKYVSKKIINGAKNIKRKKIKKLCLGNINTYRDWGWAPEYVSVFWKMLNSNTINDYIIATGKTNSLKKFIRNVFLHYELDWKKYVVYSDKFERKNGIKYTSFDIDLICNKLNWKPSVTFNKIISKMINNEIY